MKKFLSLVLALAMTMSLVVINTSAKEFTDNGDITYSEAVDVISEIGVVDGYTDGSFNPQGGLTRGAAAKIICNLILGPTTAAELHADTAPFRDVPISNEFAGYIAYCSQQGIISGYADGAFRPAAPLTGYAFMKMLLGALGYDAENEDYVGENWSVQVAKQAIGIGLNASLEGDFNGVDYVTREEAALYSFNTLKATMVDYDQKITTTVNGVDVVISQGTAKPVDWAEGRNNDGNIKNDGFVQFAEQFFPKLVLDNTTDAFGRPARNWEYDGKDIGTYVNTDILREEYTTEVTGRDLYDALGRSILTDDDYDFLISIDGETEEAVLGDAFFTEDNLLRTNTKGVGATGNGVLTQVYVDSENKDVYISVINTYLAVAADDYDERHDEASYEIWGVKDVTSGAAVNLVKTLVSAGSSAEVYTGDGSTVSGEDFDIADVKDGDIALVRVAEGEIQEILAPETLGEVEISAFKTGSWISVDGTQYDYADAIQYDDDVLDIYDNSNMKDTTYNVYLDPYGYAIGVEIVEEASQYLFLTGMDSSNSNLVNRNLEANAIFLDGTMETITVNRADSRWNAGTQMGSLMNTWCKYTVNASGVYTLTEVADTTSAFNALTGTKAGQGENTDSSTGTAANTVTLDKSHVTLNGLKDAGGAAYSRVYANDNTVFLSVETELIRNSITPVGNAVVISDVNSVATGIQNVSLDAWNAKAVQDSNTTDYGSVGLTNISNGAYTLFDKDGYVIAVVVVGEDNGSTTNYAYVTSGSMSREGYDKTTDTYTWTREAIVNGEVVTLTEQGDTNPAIGTMNQGEWYEVRYDADGNVRRVNRLSENPTGTTHSTGIGMPLVDFDLTAYNSTGKVINNIANVQNSVDANDTVLLWDNLMNDSYGVNVIGSTLQVTTATNNTMGFAVRSDAKTVLIQDSVTTSGKVTYMDDIYEYTGGTSGLERAVRNLNDNSAFKGFVGAVFENGVATSVIIYDKTETDINTGVPPVSTPGLPDVSISGLTVTVPVTTATKGQVADLAISALQKAGYTVTGVRVNAMNANEFDITASYGNIAGYVFTTDTDLYYEVSVVAGEYADVVNVPSKLMVSEDKATEFSITTKAGSTFNVGEYLRTTGSVFTVTDTAITAATTTLTGTVQFQSGQGAAGQTLTVTWTH